MIGIAGICIVFVMVFGGYAMAGGKIGIILHSLPFEMMIILGAALGAFVIGNDKHGIVAHAQGHRQGLQGTALENQGLPGPSLPDVPADPHRALEPGRARPAHRGPGRLADLRRLSPHPRRQRGGGADLRHAALGVDELRRPAPGRGGADQADREELRRGPALGAHAADHGRRPAGARHRRGRARRHQDHGLDRPAAGDPRQDDRRRAGRHLPRRLPRLRLRRAVRQPGEGGDRRGPAFLQPDPRGDGGRAAQPCAEHLRRGRAAEHARRTCAPPTTSSKARSGPPSRASRRDPHRGARPRGARVGAASAVARGRGRPDPRRRARRLHPHRA